MMTMSTLALVMMATTLPMAHAFSAIHDASPPPSPLPSPTKMTPTPSPPPTPPACPDPRIPVAKSCPCAESARQYLHDLAGCPIACYCKATRKHIHSIGAEKQSEFFTAVNKMKSTPSPWTAENPMGSSPDYQGLSWYDLLVALHASSQPSQFFAHRNVAFGAWHRVLLLIYELGLNDAMDYPTPPIASHYWDWTDGQRGSSRSIETLDWLFSPKGIGSDGNSSNGNCIPDGPFKDWDLPIYPESNSVQPECIQRTFWRGYAQRGLPSASYVSNTMIIQSYAVSRWDMVQPAFLSFANTAEGWREIQQPGVSATNWLHNQVHMVVGGSMSPLTSPNDPVFFLHHTNVDRVYESWYNTYKKAPFPVAHTKVELPEGFRVYYVQMNTGTGFWINSNTEADKELFYNLTFRQIDLAATLNPNNDDGFAGKWLSIETKAAPDWHTIFSNNEGLTYQSFELARTSTDYDYITDPNDPRLKSSPYPIWAAQGLPYHATTLTFLSPAGFDNKGGTRAVVGLQGTNFVLKSGDFTHTHKSVDYWLAKLMEQPVIVVNIRGKYTDPTANQLTEMQLEALEAFEQEIPETGTTMTNFRVVTVVSIAAVKITDEDGAWLSGQYGVGGSPATEALVLGLRACTVELEQ
jgi:tyrosinase